MNAGGNSLAVGEFVVLLRTSPLEFVRGIGDDRGGAFLASTRMGLFSPSPGRTPNSLRTGEMRGLLVDSETISLIALVKLSVMDSSSDGNVGLGSRGGPSMGVVGDLAARVLTSSSFRVILAGSGDRGAGRADRCFSVRSAHPDIVVMPSLSLGGRGGGAPGPGDAGEIMGAGAGAGRRPLGRPLLTGNCPSTGCLALRGLCERRSGFNEGGGASSKRSLDRLRWEFGELGLRPRGRPLLRGKSPSIGALDRRGLCGRQSGSSLGGGVASNRSDDWPPWEL